MGDQPARRVALCGLLTAVMLALGWVEQWIPLNVAIPGIKLGLSNGVLIFAVYLLNVPTAFMLLALKLVLSAALFAGFGALPYAAAGGVLSMVVMALLRRVKGLTPVTVSMAGGAAHNIGQVAMAMLVTRTPGLVGYMGLLMLAGMVCGALTGICAQGVMRHLPHLRAKK